MTTPRRTTDGRGRPQPASTSRLILNRNVGEGFSLGWEWRFDVRELTAQFVTLAATTGLATSLWQLEATDALQITPAGTLTCVRRAPATLAPCEIRVVRVTATRASLLIHVPRSLKIIRHDLAATGALAS